MLCSVRVYAESAINGSGTGASVFSYNGNGADIMDKTDESNLKLSFDPAFYEIHFSDTDDDDSTQSATSVKDPEAQYMGLQNTVVDYRSSQNGRFVLKSAYDETNVYEDAGDSLSHTPEIVPKGTFFGLLHQLYADDKTSFTLGFDYEKEMNADRSDHFFYKSTLPVTVDYQRDIWDAFCRFRSSLLDQTLYLDAGLNYNTVDTLDPGASWELSAGYLLGSLGTKIHGGVKTGYRPPSMVETSGSYLSDGKLVVYGNPELEPEESMSYKVGVDQSLLDDMITLSVVYFRIDLDNLIIYDTASSRYDNLSQAKSAGFGGSVFLKPSKFVNLGIAYTRSEPEYDDAEIEKCYLPRNEVNVTATIFPLDELSAFCRFRWQDGEIVPIFDSQDNSIRWTEDGITWVDMAVNYKITDNFDVWARMEGLLEDNKKEGGITMPQRWMYGGFKISF